MIGRLDPQKGFDLLADAAPRLLDARRPDRRPGQRRPEARPTVPGAGRSDPDRVALIERFDRVDGPADLRRRRLLPDAVAVRAVRAGPDDRAALRHAADRPPDRRPGRHASSTRPTDPGRGPASSSTRRPPTALARRVRGGDRDARGGRSARWRALVDRGMAVDFDWVSGSAPRYVEAYARALAIRGRG